MIVVPRQREFRLRYAGRAWPDALGWGLGAGTLLLGLAWCVRRRRRGALVLEEEVRLGAAGGSRLVKGVPLAILVALVAARLLPAPAPPGDGEVLYERASRAYAERRWDDAAEYARHGAALFPTKEPRRAELLWVGGESLLQAGHPREALLSFAEIVERATGSPHRAQALFSGAVAKEALGDTEGAALWRRRLVQQYPGNPWAERLDSNDQAPPSALEE
jgi:tetratricopeptide (TPR) repeat protein